MGMSWPGEKETTKAYSSTKEVSKYPYNSACTLCPPGMCWGLWSSSQSCAGCKGFMPTQLNQDNCADEAVDAAFISKKKGKTAWQIYASLFKDRVSTAAVVEVHLCKGLWSEELWWIKKLSSDNHMALRLQIVQEVTENLTSKNSHLSPLAFWALNHHLQDRFILRPC